MRLAGLAVLAVPLLAGMPLAAQTVQFTGAVNILDRGGNPAGVAVDQYGDVFVADNLVSGVYEILAVNGSIPPLNPTINGIGNGFNRPSGVAVDQYGDVFVADYENNEVKEVLAVNGSIPASPTINILGSGFYKPWGVAVDQHGNVFVADQGNSAVKEILAPNYTTVNTLGSGFDGPAGVAVDQYGNVFVADTDDTEVKEILAVNGSIPANNPTINVLGSGFSFPAGVAVDGSGNVYVADTDNSAVKEILAVNGSIPANNPTINTLGGGFAIPEGVAVDQYGHVFVADSSNAEVKEIFVSGNFGFVNVGSPSANILSFNFTFGASVTLGSTAVLTQGAAGLDFTDAGNDTCTENKTYSSGETCGVNVTFKPMVPGPRYGAAQLVDTSGNLLAFGYMLGTGIGPRVNFLPGTQSTLGSGFEGPDSVAVDASGDIYVTDENKVKEILAVNGSIPANPTINILGSGFDSPSGVAVDGNGNVFVADTNHSLVKEILAVNGSIPANPTINILGSGFESPSGVAVDGSGNVFVGDSGNSAVKEILAVNGSIPANPTINILGSGFEFAIPVAVAVDGSGNVFVADQARVLEIVAPNYTAVNILGGGFNNPSGVAVDGNGNVYVADTDNLAVKEILALTYTTVNTLASGFMMLPLGVAVDGKGNVYVADLGNTVTKLDYADPPSLSFATTVEGSTSTDSPKTLTVENGGNATLTFPAPATGTSPSIPSGFRLDNTTTCPQLSTNSSPGMLDANATCTYAVDFSPTGTGNFSGSLVLTDNNLNAPSPSYATQSIALSGMATAAANFGLTNSGNINVPLGATTGNTTTITVTPFGGFKGNVGLTAAFTSTPPGTTVVPILSFSSNSVSITGASAGTSTLTVSTTAPTNAALILHELPGVPWCAAGVAALACLLLFGTPAPRRRWRTVLTMVMLLVAFTGGMLGCGKAPGSGNPGTTTGTYTITVTGTAGTITQTTVVTLVVTSTN